MLWGDINNNIAVKKNLKSKPKPKPISKEIKTFDEYFVECIKNKKIPKDTPSYFRKALERAMIEYDQGIKKENQHWKILLISML